jgi:aminoglycoside 2'-N-acetyltransferase I
MSTGEAASDRARLRRVPTGALTAAELRAVRELLWAAFASDDADERFTEDDWRHALGGQHFLLEPGGRAVREPGDGGGPEPAGRILAHAAVVERELHVGGRPLRTGYVEAVATDPGRQGTGLGTRVMLAVNAYIRERFELGALGTGSHRFYERLGWLRWRGPSSVRTDQGARPTPDEDGYLMVLATPASPPLDPRAAISCEWRPGDVW